MNRTTDAGNKRWYILLTLIGIGITILVFVTGRNLPEIIRDFIFPASQRFVNGSDTASGECPYHGHSDEETFEKLLRAEQFAALTENLSTLDDIYLPGTLLTDPSGVTSPVSEHYQKKFADVDFIELDLYDIAIIKMDDTSAWVTQSASGSFVITQSGARIDYEIKPSDGYVVFLRDSGGCWKMSNFVK